MEVQKNPEARRAELRGLFDFLLAVFCQTGRANPYRSSAVGRKSNRRRRGFMNEWYSDLWDGSNGTSRLKRTGIFSSGQAQGETETSLFMAAASPRCISSGGFLA